MKPYHFPWRGFLISVAILILWGLINYFVGASNILSPL